MTGNPVKRSKLRQGTLKSLTVSCLRDRFTGNSFGGTIRHMLSYTDLEFYASRQIFRRLFANDIKWSNSGRVLKMNTVRDRNPETTKKFEWSMICVVLFKSL